LRAVEGEIQRGLQEASGIAGEDQI